MLNIDREIKVKTKKNKYSKNIFNDVFSGQNDISCHTDTV